MSVRKLPSGTVTLLFTDIEGSTRLLDSSATVPQVLAEHRALREVFSRHGGVEVNTEGDSFFVAFTRASDAVLAANGIQDTLVGGPVHVRIGIHTGEPVVPRRGTSVLTSIGQRGSWQLHAATRCSSRRRQRDCSTLHRSSGTSASTGSRT